MDDNRALFSHENQNVDNKYHNFSEAKSCYQNRKSIVIVIRPKLIHTMKNDIVIIIIIKECHTSMTILTMKLKMKRQKRIIIFVNKK